VLTDGNGRANSDDEREDEDEGLVLPPPFLADDSPKESFDGQSTSARPLVSHRDENELMRFVFSFATCGT
jgi:hypothetical protein